MEQQKQCYEFYIDKKDGIVTRIGKGSIKHPEIKFGGGSIKWYEDKIRQIKQEPQK